MLKSENCCVINANKIMNLGNTKQRMLKLLNETFNRGIRHKPPEIID